MLESYISSILIYLVVLSTSSQSEHISLKVGKFTKNTKACVVDAGCSIPYLFVEII